MSNLIKLKQIQGGLVLKQDVERLKSLVEAENTGLVTVVGELKSQVEILNGGEEVVGSVAHSIKTAVDGIQTELDGKADADHTHTADEIEETEEKQFVSKAKKDQYDENTIFNTDMLTVSALGGIAAGTDLNNMPVQDLLTKLLFPYVAPQVSASCTPNGGTFEKGNAQTVTNIRVSVTKKSEKITKIEFKDGGTVLETLTEGIENGGTFNHTLSLPVSTNKNFTVTVTDAANKTYNANTGTFNFVYPYYMGVCADDATINEDLVKGLTKKVEGKGNKTHAFTCDYQRMVFAYPKSHGALKSIIDPNNFDVTGTFGRQEVSITGLDGTAQTYYVYVNSASTVSGFNMKFNY